MSLYVDYSNVGSGRKITGIERIALDTFSAEALAPIEARHVRANGAMGMVAAQCLGLPARMLADSHALAICPGFPPSIPLILAGGDRVIAYIHDLFLLTRPGDLNLKAKLYMRPALRAAVTKLRYFLTNSEYTASELRKWTRRDAEIMLMRPQARNVFGLTPIERPDKAAGDPLKLLALSTIEPRKNLSAAAAIRRELERRLSREVHLTIVGRDGWGDDSETLRREPHVFLPGYLPVSAVRKLADEADIFISTSNDEGLGLPLLEIQYGGLAVVASDIAVFREVLDQSGLLVDPARPDESADAIVEMISAPHWRRAKNDAAAANLSRWNALAAKDSADFKAWLADLVGTTDA
ncbi:MAG: glycosyltransferase [Pseudomonadota bacterium]